MAGGQGPGQSASSSTGSGVSAVTPGALNSKDATYPGTRYGKGGTAPGQSDCSTDTIVSSASPGI